MTVQSNNKKRRKRKQKGRKLLVGTNVEVRNFDEGLKGSWHPGVVIGCEKSICLVEYTSLLDDDGSSKLTEPISVSAAVEGRFATRGTRKNYRGNIRPLPSNSITLESALTYGLCVDALVNEAWWEGVIFDCEEGSKERLVFFPDQGDQDRIGINRLRVTKDWDEVSGDWRPRGDWLFIRLLDKHKGFLPVSVRQIWYDVRACDDFKCEALEWMHGKRALWDKLVSEAVQENVCAAHGVQAVTVAESVCAEGLPIRLSKRRKTTKSQISVSGAVSRDKVALQSSDECVDQDNQVIQPVLIFPSELSVPDVGVKDAGCSNHNFPCDKGLSTCSKVSSPLSSDPGFVVPGYAVNFSIGNPTLQMVNGALGNEFPKGTVSHCEEGASTCHQASLPLPSDLDSGFRKLFKNFNSEGLDFYSDDACLTIENTVAAYDSQCGEGRSTFALPCSLQNGMEDIQSECAFNEQSLFECIGNSSRGEGAGAVHPLGGEDVDLEAIVPDNGGKTDVICVDQGAEPNINSACSESEAHDMSGQEESWKFVGKDLLPGSYTEAIKQYFACAVSNKNQCAEEIISKVKKYLLSQGWKIERKEGLHTSRKKTSYFSPKGKTYYSLREVFNLKKQKRKARSSRNGQSCVGDNNVVVCDDQGANSTSNPARGKNKAHKAPRTNGSWKPLEKESLSESEYSPLALMEYCAIVSQKKLINTKSYRGIAKKAKMHLLFMGWKIEYKHDMNKKCGRIRYVSPDNECYLSLHQACMYMARKEKEYPSSMNAWESAVEKSIHKSDSSSVESVHPRPISVAEGNCSPSCCENQVVKIKQVLPVVPLPDPVFLKSETCLQAVKSYLNCNLGKKKKDSSDDLENIEQLRSKVKMHLLAEGWSFWYRMKRRHEKVKPELCYKSPSGKSFFSLRQACVAWDGIVSKKVKRLPNSKGSKDLVNATTSTEFEGCKQLLHRQSRFGSTHSLNFFQSSDLESRSVQLKGVRTQRKRRDLGLFSLASELLHNDGNTCFPSHSMIVENAGQDGLDVAALNNKKRRHSKDFSAARKLKRRKESCALTTRSANAKSSFSMRVLRSSNREPHVVVSCSGQQTIRTVLSWLIDNDVVLPRQKVCYKHHKDHHVMAEGQITRKGIKCKCCKKVYSLSSFEAHAGSTNHRPSANIFLEDGRSLLQCQMQIRNGGKFNILRPDTHQRMKGDYSCCKSDNICSICHYGGDLILCDYCPSSFHLGCIGLKDVPEGKWSCSSCRCGICGESEFNADIEQFTTQTVICCDQCEREFHVGCLRKRRLLKLQSCPLGNWFCSKKCSKIFVCLQKLLGKSKPTAVKGLSWTILRSKKLNYPDLYTSDVDAITEHHSKLCVAASLLHECFVPLIDPRTKSDVVTDVLFNKRSELKRLNFWGFYTMILERGDEMISVAAIKIHGEKVAEIPLVGTRAQYRRQGMCRLLLNELEKMLCNLRVEWLLLPAAPQLLEAWTSSFGFTKMTSSHRLQFLDHTFLDFQDTTMCQKLLMSSTTNAAESRGTKVRDKFGRSNERNDSDGYTIPELFHTERPVTTLPSVEVQGSLLHGEVDTGRETSAHSSLSCGHGSGPVPFIQETEQIEQRETTNPISADVCTGEESTTAALTEMICPVVVAEQVKDLKCKFRGLCYRRRRGTSKPCLFKNLVQKDKMLGNETLKCYRRRCISASEKSSSVSFAA